MANLKTSLKRGVIPLFLFVFCSLASAQDARPDVDRMVQDANDRVARGESAESVEQRLRDGLDDHGMDAKKAPPDWDVFARANWQHDKDSNGQESQQGKTFPNAPAPFVVSVGEPDK